MAKNVSLFNEREVAEKIIHLLNKCFEEIFYDPEKILSISKHISTIVEFPNFLPLMRNVDYRSPLAKFTLRVLRHGVSLDSLQPVLSLLLDDPLFISAFTEEFSSLDSVHHGLSEKVKGKIGRRFLAICSDFLSEQKYQAVKNLLMNCSLFQISQKEAAQRVLQFVQTLKNFPEELIRVLEWMTQENFFRAEGVCLKEVASCQEKCIGEFLKKEKFKDARFWIQERVCLIEQPVETFRDWLQILLQQEQGVIALEVFCRFMPLLDETIIADSIALIEKKIPYLEDKQQEESLHRMLNFPAKIFRKVIHDTLFSLMEKQTSNALLVTQGIVACPFTRIEQWILAFTYFSYRGDSDKIKEK